MEPLLQISHLTKVFSDGKQDEYKAVDDVSFELFPGEKLAIIGESGSGKTTVVNMITRLLESTDGSIWLDGEDITHYKRKNMRKIYRKMQMVFQTPTESFDPRCRLGDAVAESLRNAGISKKESAETVSIAGLIGCLCFQCVNVIHVFAEVCKCDNLTFSGICRRVHICCI